MDDQEIPPDCEDEEVAPMSFDVTEHNTLCDGSNAGFALSGEETVAIGETATFRLENTTSDRRKTGNRRQYTIQRHLGGRWEHVFSVKGRLVFDTDAVGHAPGEGFEWSFAMTPVGLSSVYSQYRVCSELTPGRYRFVYFALPDWNAVTTEFELREE